MVDALRAEGVSVRRGPRTVVDAVSLRVQRGQLLAIAGPNGAGKSTLLKALLGLLPASGVIEVDGAALTSLPPLERARRIAYVPQRSATMSAVSVVDVVAQARYAHRPRFGQSDPNDPAIASALEHTETAQLARRSFETLSGGEQRRVLIARALATGARILVLDEPTSGLDIAHVLRFFRLARRLKAEGHALVCVLHELGEVRRHADLALLLDAGKSVAFGSVQHALSHEHIARVYGVRVHEHAAPGFSLDEDSP